MDNSLPKKAKKLFDELVTDKGKKRPTNLDRYKLITQANMNWCSKRKMLLPLSEFEEDPTSETGYSNVSRDASTSSNGFSRAEFLPPEKATSEEVVIFLNKKIKEGIENGRFQRIPKVLMDLINEHEEIKYSSAIQHVYLPHKKPQKKEPVVKANAVKKPAEIQKKRAPRTKKAAASKA